MNKPKAIGIVHSPYKDRAQAPSQNGTKLSTIEIFPEYEKGLTDIEGFSHLHIIYWLHQARQPTMMVYTPHDATPHGLFATRSPHRINPIAYAIIELVTREKNILTVRGLDAIDSTPVIDIKPYIPKIDLIVNARTGWLKKFRAGTTKSTRSAASRKKERS
jgi:tRNA-Thr(GGU) m(6)t(6)A37 methyltransferase TsaA